MNGRIVQEAGFDDIYVMPAAGDNGTALRRGSVCLQQCPRAATRVRARGSLPGHVLLGSTTSASCSASASLPPPSTKTSRPWRRAWSLTGRSSAGSRGAWRSAREHWATARILANPILPHMKDKINAEVKHREPFRPFAPSVLVRPRTSTSMSSAIARSCSRSPRSDPRCAITCQRSLMSTGRRVCIRWRSASTRSTTT